MHASGEKRRGPRRGAALLLAAGAVLVMGLGALGLQAFSSHQEAASPIPSQQPASGGNGDGPGHSAAVPEAPTLKVSYEERVAPEVSGGQIEVFPPGSKVWSKIGEYSRESFAEVPGGDGVHKRRIINLLQVKPGMIVADVGAGGGRIAWPLSSALGPSGVVLAIDVNPIAIETMRTRLKEEPPANDNLQVIHSHPWNVGLSRTPYQGRVDRACLIEAHFFKHFPDRKETLSCLRSLFLAMRPGSLLLVREHKGTGFDAVIKPLERAGFVLGSRHDSKESGPSFVIIFRRP